MGGAALSHGHRSHGSHYLLSRLLDNRLSDRSHGLGHWRSRRYHRRSSLDRGELRCLGGLELVGSRVRAVGSKTDFP